MYILKNSIVTRANLEMLLLVIKFFLIIVSLVLRDCSWLIGNFVFDSKEKKKEKMLYFEIT